MKFTRRDFVKFSGIAALTGFGLSGSVLGKTKSGDVLADQTTDSFSRLVGSEFYVASDNLSTTARLIKVQDFPTQRKNGECYSLVFETRLKRVEQATYRVFHENLGNFELFMTEGKNGKRSLLIATINRI